MQVPPILVSLVLVGWFLRPASPTTGPATPETAWTKLKRIDFVGALFLLLSIIGLCLLLDLAGSRLAWTLPEIAGLSGATAVTLIAFVVSACYVPNPIFPLRLQINSLEELLLVKLAAAGVFRVSFGIESVVDGLVKFAITDDIPTEFEVKGVEQVLPVEN